MTKPQLHLIAQCPYLFLHNSLLLQKKSFNLISLELTPYPRPVKFRLKHKSFSVMCMQNCRKCLFILYISYDKFPCNRR